MLQLSRVFLAACLLTCSGLSAQTLFQDEYVNPSGAVFGVSFRNSANGYIVTGTSSNTNSELFLMETDPAGQATWSTRYTLSGFPFFYGTSVIASPGGGFFTGGFATNQNQTYYTLLQTGPTGAVNWSAMYEVDPLFNITTTCGLVDTTADGGYVMVSDVVNNNTLETWTHVFRTDNGGNVVWSRMYNRYMAAKSHVADMERCPDGGYVFCGTSVDSTINLFLTRIDSAGNLLWTKHYTPVTNFGQGAAVELTQGNGFIVHGTAYNGSIQEQPVLMETDSAGNMLWTKFYAAPGNYYYGKDMAVGSNGYVMIFQGIVGGRGYMLKTDFSGNPVWTRHYGPMEMLKIRLSPGGSYVALSNSSSTPTSWLISADPIGGSNGCDTSVSFTATTLVISERSNLVSQPLSMTPVAHTITASPLIIDEVPCMPNSVRENEMTRPEIYPNPTSGSIQFKNIRPGFSVSVYSLQGECVLETKQVTGNGIDVSTIANGMYLLDVRSENGELLLREKIVVAN